MATEAQRLAQIDIEDVTAAGSFKILFAQLLGHGLNFLGAVHRLAGSGERLLVNVGRIDFDSSAKVCFTELFSHDHRDRASLLTRRATRAPDADRLFRSFATHNARHYRFRQEFPS